MFFQTHFETDNNFLCVCPSFTQLVAQFPPLAEILSGGIIAMFLRGGFGQKENFFEGGGVVGGGGIMYPKKKELREKGGK